MVRDPRGFQLLELYNVWLQNQFKLGVASNEIAPELTGHGLRNLYRLSGLG